MRNTTPVALVAAAAATLAIVGQATANVSELKQLCIGDQPVIAGVTTYAPALSPDGQIVGPWGHSYSENGGPEVPFPASDGPFTFNAKPNSTYRISVGWFGGQKWETTGLISTTTCTVPAPPPPPRINPPSTSTPATPSTPSTPRGNTPARADTPALVQPIKRMANVLRFGKTYSVVIRVRNRTRTAARNVVITDTLPRGMVLAARPKNGTVRGRTVTFRIKRIAGKATARRIIRVRVLRSAPARICNTALLRRSTSYVRFRTRSRDCSQTVTGRRRPNLPAVTG